MSEGPRPMDWLGSSSTMITRIVVAGAKGIAPIDPIAAAALIFPEDIPHEVAKIVDVNFFEARFSGRSPFLIRAPGRRRCLPCRPSIVASTIGGRVAAGRRIVCLHRTFRRSSAR